MNITGIAKIPLKSIDIYSKTLSNNTRKAYIKDLKDFYSVSDLNNITMEQVLSVNVSSAQQFRESLMAKGFKPSTVNRKLTSLSNFYNFLCMHEVGIMSYNPFSTKEGLRRVKQNKRYSNTRCLTKDEVSMMVQASLSNQSIEGIRNSLVVLLMATTGMRRSELINIKIGDIKKTCGKDVIEIVGKGEKERYVVVSTIVKKIINRYLNLRKLTYQDRDNYLLVNHSKRYYNEEHSITDKTIYNIIKEIASKSGIDTDNLSPHCLRHTFITESLSLGCKLEDVQDIVGHADISTTRRYDHTNRVINNNPAEKLEQLFLKGGEI